MRPMECKQRSYVSLPAVVAKYPVCLAHTIIPFYGGHELKVMISQDRVRLDPCVITWKKAT